MLRTPLSSRLSRPSCCGMVPQTQIIIGYNALPCLLAMLNHQKKSIRKEACWTISNITAGNQDQIQEVINVGIIRPLIHLLQVTVPERVMQLLYTAPSHPCASVAAIAIVFLLLLWERSFCMQHRVMAALARQSPPIAGEEACVCLDQSDAPACLLATLIDFLRVPFDQSGGRVRREEGGGVGHLERDFGRVGRADQAAGGARVHQAPVRPPHGRRQQDHLRRARGPREHPQGEGAMMRMRMRMMMMMMMMMMMTV
jgi:hypothetical protein